jgi:hypothetical protein
MNFRLHCAALFGLALGAAISSPAVAGVTNPDISLIGQPFARWADDTTASRKRPTLDVGETEVMIDAYLNPYARGTAIFSFADGSVDVEEAFFTMLRGLPAGLALKGGKYRVGFGKLNPAHPHTYPFADRFHVLAAYLPGAESFDETGFELSERIPLFGDLAVMASADWLQGDSFRIARTPTDILNDPLYVAGGPGDRASEPRPGVLGRLSSFVPIGDRSGVDLGVSGTQGTNNVAAAARTTIYGADAKLKYWTSANAYLLVQAEALKLDRENAYWDGAAYSNSVVVRPMGGYVFADYNFNPKYDAGASYERYQQPTAAKVRDQSVGVFAGLALMEETTSFRIGWEHFAPGATSDVLGNPLPHQAINTVTIRVLYSMGPHKAHQF